MQRKCCLLMLSLIVPLYSQTERGNITGQVRDPSGAAIPGAEVASSGVAQMQTETARVSTAVHNRMVDELPLQHVRCDLRPGEHATADAGSLEALIGEAIMKRDKAGKVLRHLPVVVEETVVGVISIGDVVRAIIEDKEFYIQQLTTYITGVG